MTLEGRSDILPKLAMASFGGVELGPGGAGVFELTSESDDKEFVHTLSDGTIAIIPSNRRYVVVRDCPGADFEGTRTQAHKAANLALDVYFGHGGSPLLVAHKESPYLVAWATPGGQTLRLVGRNLTTAKFTATLQVHDADGNLVQPPPPPPRVWHESLRYYRVSESSTDLYDSFRNLYLAVEALLSSIVPPTVTSNGNPEPEGKWLKRALGEVDQKINLAPFAPSSATVNVDAIHHDLYGNLRTATFHAKAGRAVWVPQDWSSRSDIVEARVRYARMFRALATKYLNTPYPGSGFFKDAYEDMIENSLSGQRVFVSNDPILIEDEPEGESQFAPTGGDVHTLPTVAANDMAADWCRGLKGAENGKLVSDAIGQIRRFGTLQDGQLMIVESLRGPLMVDGVTELQVFILVEGRNYGAPRQDFES